MTRPLLRRLRIRNFKAIRDCGSLELTPLTVFIGNNGSGKSSVIEALDTLRTLAIQDADAAMQMWRGIEHVRNHSKSTQKRHAKSGLQRSSKPIEFSLRGNTGKAPFSATTVLNERGETNELFIEREDVRVGSMHAWRDDGNRTYVVPSLGPAADTPSIIAPAKSILGIRLADYIESWQLVNLSPHIMGNPIPQTRTRGRMHLARTGANLAEFLLDFRTRDLDAFNSLIDTMKHVLPYATDIRPASPQGLERTVYLQLMEGGFEVPGWLFSSGTLRLLALVAVLRHPLPPTLVLIEEIENGLDPRSIRLLVEEIRVAVESGRTQVVLTTHSPYLLDVVPLESIVLVERVEDQPLFERPAGREAVQKWARKFGPGQLYTMGKLSKTSEQ